MTMSGTLAVEDGIASQQLPDGVPVDFDAYPLMDGAFSHEIDMDFLAFPNADDDIVPDMSMSEFPAIRRPEQDALPSHVDPLATWHGSSTKDRSPIIWPGMNEANSQRLEQMMNSRSWTVSEKFGHAAPPTENDDLANPMGPLAKRDSKSAALDGDPFADATPASNESPRKRARDNAWAAVKSESEGSVEEGDEKKEKYREKNRVAAAKCRAKKKENTDHLEETHRAQSMLNTALRATEQSLRDELSYCRTQALQHSFCACSPLQDYNMRKAQNMASGSAFGSRGYRNVGPAGSLQGSPSMANASPTTTSQVVDAVPRSLSASSLAKSPVVSRRRQSKA